MNSTGLALSNFRSRIGCVSCAHGARYRSVCRYHCFPVPRTFVHLGGSWGRYPTVTERLVCSHPRVSLLTTRRERENSVSGMACPWHRVLYCCSHICCGSSRWRRMGLWPTRGFSCDNSPRMVCAGMGERKVTLLRKRILTYRLQATRSSNQHIIV